MFSKKIKKVIKIEGMMCNHCKSKVEESLSSLEGVAKVKADIKEKTAIIYSTKSINNDDIKKVIENLDYKIINIEEDE